MAMMRQQSAQMEGKIDSLTNGIQQLAGAMNKDLKQKKEHKKETEPKAPVAAQASGSGCQAAYQQEIICEKPPSTTLKSGIQQLVGAMNKDLNMK